MKDCEKYEQRWRLTVGANIRQARLSADMSAEKLSSLAEVSKTFLILVELGRRNASVDLLVRLAYELNIPPADFFQN